ncbi:NUDIX domain-containing protein [Paenibacillus sp. N1-5-1-14]|uniref:NUDIX hydrolase n=1 Tax=Paenibacillus radicibacter TaxID=2972488 RepID=UPI0021597D2C|nr:NUDIX domain-containing protein [Paenibacillus radicibacter]MCR8644604.1 NUDIX domain-containing protein [Paenibacillus radicibacter]
MFIVNVEGAVCQDGKWLLITRSMKEEHAGGTLSLVGGKVDLEGFSQDILERTVKREIEEEVGVTVKAEVKFVYSSSFVAGEDCHVINIVFLCEYAEGTAHSKSPDEVEAVHWLTVEEVMRHHKAPEWTKESVRRAAEVAL